MFNGKARDTEVSSGATTTGITKVEIFLPNFKASELKSVEKLKQCINNLELSNSCAIVSHLPQLAIQTDASKKGWGAFYKEVPLENNGTNRSHLYT